MNFYNVVKSTFTLIGIAFVFAGFSAIAAPDLDATEDGFTLSGIVVDAESHDPVSGALVGIIGHELTTETNSDGIFRFNDVPAGEHTVVFQADGYEYTELEVDVSEEENEIQVLLNKTE